MYSRFVHLIWANEVKFSEPLLEVFSKNKEYLESEEHLFVTPHEDVYKKLKNYGNIIWDSSDENLFNKYALSSNWIISHDFPGKKIVLGIKKKNKKKIVFRYWGGRRYPEVYIPNKIIHNFTAFLKNNLYRIAFRYIYDDLALIGIANLVDEIDLQDLIRKTPMMRMPYARLGAYDTLLNMTTEERKPHETLNIIVGHRSEPLENHIKYITMLQKYPTDKIMIYVPLSYGNKEYAETVKKFVINSGLTNVKLITEFMEYPEYLKFINEMDIALIDCENSLALGNIAILLSLKKTIYVSRDGIIKKALDIESVPHHCLDEIDEMSFEQFSKILEMNNYQSSSLAYRSYASSVDDWKKVLDFLKEKEKS